MVGASQDMPSAWDGHFEAALGSRTRAPGSCPGTSCLLLSLLPAPDAPLPSVLPGPAAGRTFASEAPSGTPGLTRSVCSIKFIKV